MLIVEDEPLVAMHLAAMLRTLGHVVAAEASRIDSAMELAGSAAVDFAVLDVNLAGTMSFPVADILAARAIPFVFATGYGIEGLAPDYRSHPALHKPYGLDDLKRVMAQVPCPIPP